MPTLTHIAFEPISEGVPFATVLQVLMSDTNWVAWREGWNGKGMFVFLVPGSKFTVNRRPLLGLFAEGTEIEYRPHLDLCAADGTIGPWLISQTDALATDWTVARVPPTGIAPPHPGGAPEDLTGL